MASPSPGSSSCSARTGTGVPRDRLRQPQPAVAGARPHPRCRWRVRTTPAVTGQAGLTVARRRCEHDDLLDRLQLRRAPIRSLPRHLARHASPLPGANAMSTARSDCDAHSIVQTNISPAAGDASMLDRVSPREHRPRSGSSALPSTSPRRSAVPTVVLAHGAFADASSWGGVIVELQSAGTSVLAPPNPLRTSTGMRRTSPSE
jgi:hypothetical protein